MRYPRFAFTLYILRFMRSVFPTVTLQVCERVLSPFFSRDILEGIKKTLRNREHVLFNKSKKQKLMANSAGRF